MKRPSRLALTTAAALLLVPLLACCGRIERLDVSSPWFELREDQLGLFASYSGWDTRHQRRFSQLNIGPKALQMIAEARSVILVSVFLFDNFYAPQEPSWDVVEAVTLALLDKKRQNPDIVIAIILDPSNRAYDRRVAPAVQRLIDAGVDVFYSDLLTTRAHTPLSFVEAGHHFGRIASQATSGALGWTFKSLNHAIRLPYMEPFDGAAITLQMALNAALIKANHRKILATDGPRGFAALVSSANPHNASVGSTNFAISVEGDLAKYIYDVQRSDIEQAIKLRDRDYVVWHTDASRDYRRHYLARTLPDFDRDQLQRTATTPGAARAGFITENSIERAVIGMLDDVQPDDQVRIQMFYLSDPHVLNALMRAAERVRTPVRLLLDPNKDAFGRVKDGTPNRQVAALLMNRLQGDELRRLRRLFPDHIVDGRLRALNLEVRWFDTHGEQNHAKIMSITNPATGKFALMNGSANWTGKNLDNINMEANLQVAGAPQLVAAFNQWFDLFYHNAEGQHFSVAYDHPVYSRHTGLSRWINGERWGFVAW